MLCRPARTPCLLGTGVHVIFTPHTCSHVHTTARPVTVCSRLIRSCSDSTSNFISILQELYCKTRVDLLGLVVVIQ